MKSVNIYRHKANVGKTIVVLILIFSSPQLDSQTIISQFDFNSSPLTAATVGPNATSINSNTTTDGTAMRVTSGFGASTGVDLEVPNTANVFDVSNIIMAFSFQRDESNADFFERGDTRFYIQSGQLRIKYATSDGAGGSIVYGPTNTGYTLNTDNTYREYKFSYDNLTGVATVSVNGATVWTYDGPDNRDLYWTGAGNVNIGKIMDGNGEGNPYLNYAIISTNNSVLPIILNSFSAEKVQAGVKLSWETASEINNDYFIIERATDPINFEELILIKGQGNSSTNIFYEFIDENPPNGILYYRLKQIDFSGELSYVGNIVSIDNNTIENYFYVYPNPSNGSTLFFNFVGLKPEILVVVLDAIGREFYSKVIRLNHFKETIEILDLKNRLPSGLYYVTGTSDNKIYNQKLIVR